MNLTELFRYLVSLSLLGSILAIGLLLIKFLFRQKLSANWHYYIWFVPILRLVIPFTPASPFSVLNLWRRIVMISAFKKTPLKWSIAALALTLIVGCSSLSNPINPTGNDQNFKNTALNSQQNATEQVLINDQIAKYLESIISSPQTSSNPQEYINAHQNEYNAILAMDAQALPYLFSLFEKGGQTGLQGHIMERLSRTILGSEDIKYLSKNPQDWYDTYKEHIRKLVTLNSLEFVQQHYPKGSLILSPSSSADSSSIVYKNTQYGFNFSLPQSWQGYSIIPSTWGGADVKTLKILATGPQISIRHPQWTSANQRQDIPIMIFTVDQWNSLEQGLFHIGPAPINPSELGRNSSYVFALPARYNYAFPPGYQEVEKIFANKPLQPIQAAQPPQTTDPTAVLLSNMMQLAHQGEIFDFDFPTKFPVKTTNIETVEKDWGKPDSTDYIASAKGTYATYLSHNIVFGFNKGGQIFEIRSYASQLKSITLSKVTEFFGAPPAYSSQYNGQWIFGYTAGPEFKIEFVFSPATATNPNPGIDHYNVLYPQGTANGMADDPGRQW